VTAVSTPAPSPHLLTQWTSCGGCAAKWGGAPLRALVADLVADADPALMIGLAPFDDAAVYRLSDDLAVVSTTDFFPPLVDGAADFGAIAAANACSDVFAMGGRVIMALNIAAFPPELPTSVIADIIAAASDVVRLAGGAIVGGHTIRSSEPIFGLAVQGLVHPDRIFTKGGARPGDVLVLSKPVGTGLVLAGGTIDQQRGAISEMKRLNRAASELLQGLGHAVHAVTDVTGFGLAGHSWEMAERGGVRFNIDTSLIPMYDGARDAAERGVRTGGDPRNREYLAENLEIDCGDTMAAVCFDPQTSGGLLAAVSPDVVGQLDGFYVIGEVADGAAQVHLA
jgi:selenide, water dikinase